jgi:hypothetical protein
MTREFIRYVPTTALIAAVGCVMFGVAAGPAHASTSALGIPAGTDSVSFPPPHQGPPPGWHQGPPPGWHQGGWWPQADLTITVQQAPSSVTQTWRLTCAPNGGTLPDPNQACARLSQVWQPFRPISNNTMCTTLFFGPQTIAITGWWHGVSLSVRYNRTNGCEESLFNQMVWALGLPDGEVNPGGPIKPPPPPPSAG